MQQTNISTMFTVRRLNVISNHSSNAHHKHTDVRSNNTSHRHAAFVCQNCMSLVIISTTVNGVSGFRVVNLFNTPEYHVMLYDNLFFSTLTSLVGRHEMNLGRKSLAQAIQQSSFVGDHWWPSSLLRASGTACHPGSQHHRHSAAPSGAADEDTSFRCFPYLTHPVLNLHCAVFL